ncbi:hypothetical protein AB0B31_28260 [Catellatospora citrea]|uniref:hypothetical protein n=1 Tax=Catellatospora citrea TaxID=53366 RepID=UPI0033C3524F
MKTALLFARTRCQRALAPVVCVSALVQLLVVDKTYYIFTSDSGLQAAVAPFLPVTWGVLAGFALLNRQPSLEGRAGRMYAARFTWAACLITGACLLVLPVAFVSDEPSWPLVRNGLMMVGLSMCAARLVGALRAWVPVVLFASLCFFGGHRYESDQAWPWALLLLPSDNHVGTFAAVGIGVLGIGLYTLLDSRPSIGAPAD